MAWLKFQHIGRCKYVAPDVMPIVQIKYGELYEAKAPDDIRRRDEAYMIVKGHDVGSGEFVLEDDR